MQINKIINWIQIIDMVLGLLGLRVQHNRTIIIAKKAHSKPPNAITHFVYICTITHLHLLDKDSS